MMKANLVRVRGHSRSAGVVTRAIYLSRWHAPFPFTGIDPRCCRGMAVSGSGAG